MMIVNLLSKMDLQGSELQINFIDCSKRKFNQQALDK
jgi:hypothetical protein